MRAGDLRAGLIAPVLVYVAIGVLVAPFPRSPAVLLGIGVSLGPLLVGLRWPKLLVTPYVPWLATIVVTTIALSLPGHLPALPSPRTGAGLGVGLLVGLPLLLVGALVRWRDSLAASVGVASVGLVAGTLEFAVVRALPSSASQTLGAWTGATRDVVDAQWGSLSGSTLLTPTSAPLGFIGDNLYDLLGLLAVMGLLFSMLLSSERLAGGRAEDEGGDAVEASVGFAVQQLPASAYSLSGIVPACVTLVALILVVLSNSVEGPTLLGVTVAAWAVLVVLFALGVSVPRSPSTVERMPTH